MGKKKELPSIKVCIVGSKNVGKYSLGQQFAKGWIEPKDSNGKRQLIAQSLQLY